LALGLELESAMVKALDSGAASVLASALESPKGLGLAPESVSELPADSWPHRWQVPAG
jgi:hypothetical protein